MSAILGIAFAIFAFIFLPTIMFFTVPIGWLFMPMIIIGLLLFTAYKIYSM
uniref:Uncharacterized protein n=1 Tax=viral metagenome TaxID=1070528 RepID=A0A6C0LPZ2_9ZZZZ